MARTKTRSKRQSPTNNKGPKAVITRSAEERRTGNKRWIRLDDDKKFVGHALFDPDPAAEDNPGYLEYDEHWDNQMQRMVPCWGIENRCIYCKAGQTPSHRGLGIFLVSDATDEKFAEPELRIFKFNWSTLQTWIDELDEEGSTLGQKVRIKCVSRGDGDYTTKFYEKDRLLKKDIKEQIKNMTEISLEGEVQKQLDSGLEALRIQDVLEADDEDEDDDDVTDEVDDEDDEDDDDVTAEADDDEEEEEEDEDEEEDDDEDEDEEDADEEEDDDEKTTAEGLDDNFTIKTVNESENTVTLKELDTDLYFDQDLISEIDFEDYKKGDTIHVVAEQDDDDDWVAVTFEKIETKKKPSNGRKTRGKARSKKS